jgi:hypothetical protein
MYAELYQYLLNYKQLTLPAIGTFLLERKPAEADIASRMINPPVYTIALQSGVDSSSKKIYDWLASSLNVSDREAVIRFNDFSFDLKQRISSGNIIKWNGVGTLRKDSTGQLKFDPVNTLIFEQSVPAQKVIRKTAEHTVLVGEQEKTSTQMTEFLSHSVRKRSYWWTFALVLGLLTIIFTLWYFSEHGLNISSMGNNKKLNPQKAPTTYKTLQ